MNGPYDPDIDPSSLEVAAERFRGAFAFVVAGARPGGADVAKIAFALRMLLGVAIDLAGRGHHEPRTRRFGEPEQLKRAGDAGHHRVDRIDLIMGR
jgi:hypothetical protein